MKKIWIFAGEASGDLYGARLGEALRKLAAEKNIELELSGMGGPQMMASGIPVKVDSTELGVMGVVEVLKLLFTSSAFISNWSAPRARSVRMRWF